MMTNPFSEKVSATSPPFFKAAGQSKKNRPLERLPFAETLTKEINGKSASVLKASGEHSTKPAEDQQISSNTDVTSSAKEEIKKPTFEQGGANKELNNTNGVVALGESPKQLSDDQQEPEKLTTALQEAASEQGESKSWRVLLSVIRSVDGDQNGTISMENSMGVFLVEEAVPNIQSKSTELDRVAEALISQQQHIAESQGSLSASQGLGSEKELTGLLAEAETQNAISHGTKSIEKTLEGTKNSKSSESTPVVNLSSGSEVTSHKSSSRDVGSLVNILNQPEDETGASSQSEALIAGMKTNGGQQRISSPQGEIKNEVKLNSLNKVMLAADEQAMKEVLNKGTGGAQFASTAENNPSLEQVGSSKKESGIGLQKFSDVRENDVVQHSIPLTQLNQSSVVESRAKANETHTAASIFQQTITNLETLLKGDQKFLRIQLYPENLGGLEIKLSSQGGSLQISIIADNAITQQALERHAQELQQVLQQSGVNLTGLTINQRQAQQGTEQQHTSQGKRRSQTWIQQSDDENIQAVIPSQMTAYSAVGSSRVDFFV